MINENPFKIDKLVSEDSGLHLRYGKYYTRNAMREGMKHIGQLVLEKNEKDKEFIWIEEYEQVLDWMMDNKGRSLCLAGNCGTGKSLILKIISYIITEASQNLPYECTSRKNLRLYSGDMINTTNKTIGHILDFACVLAIDDVGTEDVSTIFGQKIDRFPKIIERIESHGGTIAFSTNLNGEQMKERYGTRTTDRLRHICKFVVFKGKSMRGR